MWSEFAQSEWDKRRNSPLKVNVRKTETEFNDQRCQNQNIITAKIESNIFSSCTGWTIISNGIECFYNANNWNIKLWTTANEMVCSVENDFFFHSYSILPSTVPHYSFIYVFWYLTFPYLRHSHSPFQCLI